MPSTRTAVLFPGQGAHDCQMLDSVATASRFPERYEVVRQVLDADPAEELRKGNREFLNQNKVSSLLTILVSSLFWDRYLSIAEEAPKYYAGYSVGQWTALYASGMLSFQKLVDIVAARADFMDACSKEIGGAMLAIIGVHEAKLEEYLNGIRKQGHFIAISNYNCLGQYSVAGTRKAIEIAYENAETLNPRRVVILPVQGAWHCRLLKPAEEAFAAYLKNVSFSSSNGNLVMDMVTGAPLSHDAEVVKHCMACHISYPVQWERGMKYMIQEGCIEFVELGYGSVLSKFGFFIDRDLLHRPFYCA